MMDTEHLIRQLKEAGDKLSELRRQLDVKVGPHCLYSVGKLIVLYYYFGFHHRIAVPTSKPSRT
jgi:hypothetical protein